VLLTGQLTIVLVETNSGVATGRWKGGAKGTPGRFKNTFSVL